MKFVALTYVWLFWLVPLAVVFSIWTARRRRQKTERLISPDLWPQMMPGFRPARRRVKAVLVILGILFACIALLRPQWGYTLREVKRKGIDLFVLVDTSDSMLAGDISPNRMERAKRELVDLLKYLHGDRIGLIAFAGRPFVACPLTTDYEAFGLFVDALDTDLIPVQGTDISGAVETALNSFSSDEGRSKAIILITDGEDTFGRPDAAAEKASVQGVRVFVIGMGSEKGAPIPLREGNGFKKDRSGNMVISRLDEASLQRMALAAGGSYVRSVTGDLDLEQIYLKGIKEVLQARELKSENKIVGEERFQIPLLLALLFLLLEPFVRETKTAVKFGALVRRLARIRGRRLGVGVLLFFLFVGHAGSAWAFAPFAFDRANGNYENEKYEEAKTLYEKILAKDPDNPKVHYNLADTYFRLGEFEKAEEHYLKASSAKESSLREYSLYNLGNTKYRQQKLEESIAYYDKVLEMNPKNEKAAANREFVKKLLKEQEKSRSEQQKQDQEQKEQQQQDQQESEQQAQQQQQQQQQAQQQQEQQQGQKGDKDQNEGQKQPESKAEADQPEEDQKEASDGEKPMYNAGEKSLSKEEAEFWLGAIQDDPKKAAQDMMKREVPAERARVEKDW
ncbi:MAG: VWA domain-containing protein [Deltaproteobacteria bacterium]|nr:VWA domain-containing protein [Deltaproteobacteria bacterium]